jgi:hypothetical protein
MGKWEEKKIGPWADSNLLHILCSKLCRIDDSLESWKLDTLNSSALCTGLVEAKIYS